MQYILEEKEYNNLIPKDMARIPIANFFKTLLKLGTINNDIGSPTITIEKFVFQNALDTLEKELKI
jgi:hypothetical protein